MKKKIILLTHLFAKLLWRLEGWLLATYGFQRALHLFSDHISFPRSECFPFIKQKLLPGFLIPNVYTNLRQKSLFIYATTFLWLYKCATSPKQLIAMIILFIERACGANGATETASRLSF